MDAEDPRVLAERDGDVIDENLRVSVGLTGFVRRKVRDCALCRRNDELLGSGPGADSIQILLQPALEFLELDAGSAEREVVSEGQLFNRAVRHEEIEEDRSEHRTLGDAGAADAPASVL